MGKVTEERKQPWKIFPPKTVKSRDMYSDINIKDSEEVTASILNTESTLQRISETYNASRISIHCVPVVLSTTQKVTSINSISMNEFFHNLKQVTKWSDCQRWINIPSVKYYPVIQLRCIYDRHNCNLLMTAVLKGRENYPSIFYPHPLYFPSLIHSIIPLTSSLPCTCIPSSV